MKIALCAPFMEADLWQERIARVAADIELQFYEFNRAGELMAMPGLRHYDVIWMVVDGARGMEAVRELREKDNGIPIVWVSNDFEFWILSFNLSVAGFLPKDCTDIELSRVIDHCIERIAG